MIFKNKFWSLYKLQKTFEYKNNINVKKFTGFADKHNILTLFASKSVYGLGFIQVVIYTYKNISIK